MRINKKSIHNLFIRLLWVILVASLLITACSKKPTEADQQPLQLATVIPQPQIAQTPNPVISSTSEISPTATATLLPVSQGDSTATKAGLIILSMDDGEYNHLFAYHPSYLAVTRLTSDAWDDNSPAVSPDGNKIAFTSTRNGTREIFVLDLPNNTLTQVTNIGAFVGSISWSSDGNYIVYDVYQNGHFDLIIQSIIDLSEAPIQLTDGTSNSFQPTWSPDGSEIAFVSDRSGRNEIWLARLQNPDERFVKVLGVADADLSHPVWSPDGTSLAVSQHQTDDEVLIIQPHHPDIPVFTLGKGKDPVWMPDGTGILVTLALPNQTEILAYSVKDQHLLLPPIPMSGSVTNYDWKAGSLSTNIQAYCSRNTITPPALLWTDQVSTSGENGRRSLVPLENVNAPQTVLSDAVDDNFTQLRSLTQMKTGWDVLGTLENTTLPPTSTSLPDIPENWLFTGRAVALNMAPYEADWMVVSREEFTGETYWQVWIKCKAQDGTCGEPIKTSIWDFNSRFSGQPLAYENGGEVAPAPSGFWVDFTNLALRFGWERLPSLNNWRSYFPGILFNTFVQRQGLTWQQALLDIYPPDQVQLIIEKSQ